MKPYCLITHSPKETQNVGEQLARLCRGGEIICLSGDLGAGKTTFVKGIARGLGIGPRSVNSPTFVIMNAYEGRLPLYHFDFYRIENPDEIAKIGYDEFLYGHGVAVAEWSQRFGPLQPRENLAVTLVQRGENKRQLNFLANGERSRELLKRLTQQLAR